MPVNPNLPVVACAKAEDIKPEIEIPPDCLQSHNCVGCGAALMTAASSRTLIETGEVQPTCDVCTVTFLAMKAEEYLENLYRQALREQAERN